VLCLLGFGECDRSRFVRLAGFTTEDTELTEIGKTDRGGFYGRASWGAAVLRPSKYTPGLSINDDSWMKRFGRNTEQRHGNRIGNTWQLVLFTWCLFELAVDSNGLTGWRSKRGGSVPLAG
jgi:hypothetical protein